MSAPFENLKICPCAFNAYMYAHAPKSVSLQILPNPKSTNGRVDIVPRDFKPTTQVATSSRFAVYRGRQSSCRQTLARAYNSWHRLPQSISSWTCHLGYITSTSAALRYLACGGDTAAPLDAQDGIGFELVVQHDLVRLGEVYNSLQNSVASCWVGACNLSQPWPPSSTWKVMLIYVVCMEHEIGLQKCTRITMRISRTRLLMVTTLIFPTLQQKGGVKIIFTWSCDKQWAMCRVLISWCWENQRGR